MDLSLIHDYSELSSFLVPTHAPLWRLIMKEKAWGSTSDQRSHSNVSRSHSESLIYFAYVVQYCRLVNKNQHKVNI